MIRSFKAVFFDAGGTLFHPYPSVGEIYRDVAARYGSHAPAGELQRLFVEAWRKRDGLGALQSHLNEKIEKEGWRELVRQVFDQAGGVEDFENFFEELYVIFARPEVWRLYPGVLAVLGELKKRGHRLGIVSNWDSRLLKLCEGLGLNPYLEFVLASAVFGASKPSPRIFGEALRQTGVLPEEAVHIGDSYEDDVKGALAAGIAAILIERGGGASDIFPQVKRIRHLEELLQ